MMKRWKVVGIVGLMVAVTSAEMLVGWDVAGVDLDDGFGVESNVPPFTFYSTTSGSVNVSAALSLGSGVLRSTSPNQYGFKISAALQTNTLAGAIAQNQFIDISITIDEGYELNLDSVEMKGQSSEQTGCSNVVFMTSIDGFIDGNEIANAMNVNTTGGFDTDSSGFGQPIDLSAGKYQNLTGTVSFRLYGWNSAGGAGATYIRDLSYEDLVVNGDVVMLPESGGLVLAVSSSNGIAVVSAEFDGVATTNHVLQTCTNLASNDWNTVSGFSTDTNWVVEATNNACYYRAIVQ